MWVLSRKRLKEFWTVHADAAEELQAWHKVVEKARWTKFTDVRSTFSDVDKVGLCYVFNINGNRYRLIIKIHHNWKKVFACVIVTHKEYDRGNWKKTCGCG